MLYYVMLTRRHFEQQCVGNLKSVGLTKNYPTLWVLLLPKRQTDRCIIAKFTPLDGHHVT